MSLEWKCTLCLGRGYNPESEYRPGPRGPAGEGPGIDWHNVKCSACKGTGKLPYRKENEDLFVDE